MTEQKEPVYAPGHELTLHPGDPVKGAELLKEREDEAEEGPPQERPAEPRRSKRLYF